MKVRNKTVIYIVAGDEMEKTMGIKFPNRIIIPFRENLSIGLYNSYSIDDIFIEERTKVLNVSKDEYTLKMQPIIDLDINKDYILVFGEDDCCKANLNFMINYLKEKGYSKKIKVNIVDEYTLDLIKEYEL